jgi:hypothetical protein
VNSSLAITTTLATPPGSYTFTVFANGAACSQSGTATGGGVLVVTAPPAITSANNTTFTVNAPGTFAVTATGVPAPTFSVTSGSLPSGVTLSSAGVLSGTPALGTVGSYLITINATNGIAPDATQIFTLTVQQATATVTLTQLSQNYNAQPKTVGVNTNPNGLSVSVTYNGSSTPPTNAGSYAVVATIDDTANYTSTPATGTLVINKTNVNPTITVTPYHVTEDGNSHTATGTATGVGGENLSSSLDLSGTTHTAAGDYAADPWTFSNPNYSATPSGTVHDIIDPACTSPNVTTQPSNVTTTYGDGDVNFTAHASGSPAPTVQWQVNTGSGFGDIPGATSDTLTIHNPTVAISGHQYQAVFTNSCTPATATSNAKTLTVNKATAIVVVTPYHATYDCNPHTAEVTSITGKYGETGAIVGTVNVSNTTHTDAGTYSSDTWSFTGTANYNDIPAGPATTITDSIAKAPSSSVVTVSNTVYNCSPQGGTAVVTGVCGLNQSLPVKYIGRNTTVYGPSNTAPTDAGAYTAQARYPGDANHLTSNDSKDFTIAKANADIHVMAYHVTFNCNAHTATGTAKGACDNGNEDLSSLLDLSGTTHTDAGTYNGDAWSFAGNANYNSASATVDDSIAKDDTTSSVTSNVNPSTFGQAVSFTATVSGGSALTCTPTGTVTFKDGGTTLMAGVALTGGSATFSTSSLSAGHHSITAVYSGDGNFNATGTGASTAPSYDQWVQYNFIGFLQPVDNLPMSNSAKAGQDIPVKWQLKDAAGNLICDLSTLAPSGLQSIQIVCNSTTTIDAIEELASPGSTMFRCDGTQFIFNWQTKKSWAGTCRLMTVTLSDGTTHSAQFTFK